MDAQSGTGLEQGSMHTALDKPFVQIKKLICRPVKTDTGVGAPIEVGVPVILPADNKPVQVILCNRDPERETVTGRKGLDTTDVPQFAAI